jgi:hypothetical protein
MPTRTVPTVLSGSALDSWQASLASCQETPAGLIPREPVQLPMWQPVWAGWAAKEVLP